MPIKRKKFIDKKKAVSFRLVHRSQKDPLVADETAPQHVLLEYQNHENVEDKRKEEQRKFGVYFDDNYNYLQHLRDVTATAEWEPVGNKDKAQVSDRQDNKEHSTLTLPSSVFQSNVEEHVGLLNKSAPTRGPRPDWDPDIVAALDDDFDFDNSENELEDDFVALANPQGTESNDQLSSGEYSEDEESDVSFEADGCRFTNYSMSSSVLPRSENLQDIDTHFEKFFEKYDDVEIGPLDSDDIHGYLKPDSEVIQQLVDEFTENHNKRTLKDIIFAQNEMENIECCSTEEEFIDVIVEEKNEEMWDCESIISTYSTTNNRPKLISEPRQVRKIEVSSKSGLPRNTLSDKGLTTRMLKKLDECYPEVSNKSEDTKSRMTVASIRLKNETPEEKKERKTTIKHLRRDRRAEKKANKMAFKEEEKRQEKVLLNLRKNLNGIKLL